MSPINWRTVVCAICLSIVIPAAGQSEDESACSPAECFCDFDPTPSGVMISHVHPKKEWMLSYRYMTMNMAGLASGTEAVESQAVLNNYSSSPDLMQMRMHMLMAMYGITDRLTVMAMFGYNKMYMEMTMTSGSNVHHHPMENAGFADTKLYALYALSKSPGSQLLISGGLSLPTGSIDKKGPNESMVHPGQRYSYDMQIGSGTFDLLPGLTWLAQNNRLTWSAQLSSVILTGKNDAGYALGNELTINLWSGWQWFSFLNTTFRMEGNIAGRVQGKDTALDAFRETSTNSANYGGKRAVAFLGATFGPVSGAFKKHRFGLEYGMPVYQDLNGIQLRWTNALNVSWSLKI